MIHSHLAHRLSHQTLGAGQNESTCKVHNHDAFFFLLHRTTPDISDDALFSCTTVTAAIGRCDIRVVDEKKTE